jgi:foldase protein PrsA
MQILTPLIFGSATLLLWGCNAAMNPPELPAKDVAPDIALLWPAETAPAVVERKIIPGVASLGVDNGIIAVVNQKAITLKEFDLAFLRALRNKDWQYNEEELYMLVLDNFIERQLLLEYAKSKKEEEAIVISEDQIDSELDQMIRRIDGGWESYRRMLEEEKLSIEEMREQIKENLIINQAQNEIFRGMGSPSPKEIQQEYQNTLSEFTIPEQRDISMITIYMGDYSNDPQKGENLVKKIKKSLDEGEDFAKIAKRYSDGAKAQDGGHQGWVKAKDLAQDISREIFKMQAQEINGPHKTGELYYFLQCHEIQSAKTKDFNDVQQELRERCAARQRGARKKEFLDKLFANSHIEKLSPKEYLKYRLSLRPTP